MYNAKEKRLELDGISMNYISFGKGEKNLIMIQGLNTNGISGSANMLGFMYRIFAKDYKVHIFDRRDNIDKDITVREFASDIAFAMDKLEIRSADVLGVSQGGMIAQYLAIDRPDLVNKLVLAVTLSKKNETIETVISDWIRMTEQNDIKNLVKDMAEKMYTDSYVRKYKYFMPLLTILQKPKDVPRFITLAKANLTCNAYDELDKIQCPVFVIGGRKDKVVGEKSSDEISEKLGCKKHIYENLGHSAYEEAKDFNQIVYDFLKS
ncbi:MAG: alpha/beta hydrolase [Oscillospiraceae bacterium]|nr:alpha/beta hydrolase [Oscillospiraceae bacterium]